ncbi:MAG: hypothetical protein AB8C13_02400 [Phycisphaerales bacterium]
MTMERAKPHERIDALLAQMRMLCSEIEQIGAQQQKQLEDDELIEFVQTLESRNPKIESLGFAGKQIQSLLDDRSVTPGQVLATQQELSEISALIVGVLERDSMQQTIVDQRRSELSKQLSGVGASKNAVRAYSGGNQTPNPTLQDREG